MKYYIISGEASGDLHGSNLIKELKSIDKESEFRVWGGDMMQNQGAEVVKHYRDLAFMGFIEVIQNIRSILGNISFCKRDLSEYNPDVIILIDYPGFNLRIAEYAKKAGYKVIYYISPKIWAWKKSRIRIIKRYVDHMFIILPFEKAFYKELDYHVDFEGHPLFDSMIDLNIDSERFRTKNILSDKRIIALLPGSRKQEINIMLPVMLKLLDYYPDYQFVIGGAPGIKIDFYSTFCQGTNIPVIFDQTQELLANSVAAVVTSGTATLEAALLKVPEIVCYKAGIISFYIARLLANIEYISLPNLIMENKIVTEFIQKSMTFENIKSELDRLLFDGSYRSGMLDNFNLLSEKLGGKGASKKIAKKIIAYL